MILFLTKDGVFSFNGVKVSKLKVELLNLNIDCENAVAATLQNKYYLALKINFNDNKTILCEADSYVNNALIVIDINDYSCEIVRGADIKGLLAVKTEEFEKMLAIFNSGYKNRVGEIVNVSHFMENNLPKFWQSENLIPDAKNKLFTSLCVYADKGVKFTIMYDNKELSFTTYKEGLNQFAFKIMCKKIKLQISSNNLSGKVDGVYLDYYEE